MRDCRLLHRVTVARPCSAGSRPPRPGVQVAAITRRADGYFIVHVDSGKPGDYPSVNGAAIGEQARKLADNDVIMLAGVKLGFFEG